MYVKGIEEHEQNGRANLVSGSSMEHDATILFDKDRFQAFAISILGIPILFLYYILFFF